MIYILAGMAKSGKSTVAHDIFVKYQMQTISTDWIMMMLFHGNKELNIDVSKSDVTVSHLLEPYLEGLIKALLESKNNILVEGVHIQPEFADRLMRAYPNKLKCVFLGYTEIDPHIKAKQLRDHASMIDNPWYMHMNDDDLQELTRYLQKESEKLFEACIQFNKTYIEVKDIMKDKQYIMETLLSNLD